METHHLFVGELVSSVAHRNSGFTPENMVMFHIYVNLPEDRWN